MSIMFFALFLKYLFPFLKHPVLVTVIQQALWSRVSGSVLLLSRFSRVQLCATPETAAHQAPQSLGFSRQEHWSGLPFPSPMHESENECEVAQSSPTPSDPMDCSLPGSSIHGIFQARVLEWGGSVNGHNSWKVVCLGKHNFFKLFIYIFLTALGLSSGAQAYLPTRHVGSYFPSQGSNLHPLHWKVDSYPLDHQGSP